jgi:hypothetical protein
MAIKHPKRPRDSNQLAKMILDLATGDKTDPGPKANATPSRAAGGLKGGPARAKALTAEKRAEIAQKAAKARWSSKD